MNYQRAWYAASVIGVTCLILIAKYLYSIAESLKVIAAESVKH